MLTNRDLQRVVENFHLIPRKGLENEELILLLEVCQVADENPQGVFKGDSSVKDKKLKKEALGYLEKEGFVVGLFGGWTITAKGRDKINDIKALFV